VLVTATTSGGGTEFSQELDMTNQRASGVGALEGSEMAFLTPMDVKRLARVPYDVVLGWLTDGHPCAGVLPSIDLAGPGRRHSYRIRRHDWEAFLARLGTRAE
jgi:hypothetical protein